MLPFQLFQRDLCIVSQAPVQPVIGHIGLAQEVDQIEAADRVQAGGPHTPLGLLDQLVHYPADAVNASLFVAVEGLFDVHRLAVFENI